MRTLRKRDVGRAKSPNEKVRYMRWMEEGSDVPIIIRAYIYTCIYLSCLHPLPRVIQPSLGRAKTSQLNLRA